MTLNNHKNKKCNLLILVSGLILLSISLANIFIYNRVVNFQHLLKNGEKQAQELSLANIELKNQIYNLLDNTNLFQLANNKGLTKVQKPQYLEVNSNESLSFHHINN